MDQRIGDNQKERARRPVRNKRYNRRNFGEERRPPKRLFTPEIKRYLKGWLVRRRDNPYPNRDEKKALALQTGLTYIQVCNWFANWRRKLKNAGKEPQRKTWGYLIKTYNSQVQGNVEHFSICSDDSIWEDDGSGQHHPVDIDAEQYENFVRQTQENKEFYNKNHLDHCYTIDDVKQNYFNNDSNVNNNKVNNKGYKVNNNSYNLDNNNYDLDNNSNNLDNNSYHLDNNSYNLDNNNYNLDNNSYSMNNNNYNINDNRFSMNNNSYNMINNNVQQQCYFVSSTTENEVEANSVPQQANKYKNHIMEKYLRDCQKVENIVSENNVCNYDDEIAKPSIISKWRESAANFRPSEKNYLHWTLSKTQKKKKKTNCHQDNGNYQQHGREELDAAETLTRLANAYHTNFTINV